MTELVVITEYGHRVCTFTSTILQEEGAGLNVPESTVRLSRMYFDTKVDYSGVARIELTQALTGDILSAPRTEAFCLIAVALMKGGAWDKLTFTTQLSFMPYLHAKTAAVMVRIKRMEKLRSFLKHCRICTEMSKRGVYSREDAAAEILGRMPSKAIVQAEYHNFPELINALVMLEEYTRGIADPTLGRMIRDYIGEK